MTDANEPGPIERFSAAAVADDRPMIFSRWLLDFSRTIDAEIAALHAKIAALKAERDAVFAEVEPARETGWAVKNSSGGLYTRVAGFEHGARGTSVLWFPNKKAAGGLVGALGYGEPVLLYADTLEEVDA